MRYFITVLIISSLVSCTSEQEKQSVDYYYSPQERDSLLADIITYVYVRPPHSTSLTRFDRTYRNYYLSNLGKFQFVKYFVTEEGMHYFYLIRPARSMQGNQRGVGGSFRRDADGHIKSFREIFDTPVGDTEMLITRGTRLFNEMIRKGNVDDYVRNPDYIEWPDKITYYDTTTYEWLVKPGI